MRRDEEPPAAGGAMLDGGMEEQPRDDARRRPPLLLVGILLGALVGAVAGGGAGYVAGSRASKDAPTALVESTATPAAVTQVRVEQSSAISDAVEKVLPSMVVLEVTGPDRRDSQGRLIQTTAAGSGVIIDARGYLVTNAHVVEGAQLITVHLHDGRSLPGVVVADDLPFTDIAVVRIQEGSLTAADLGDSDALRLGDTVATLGTPVANPDLPLAFENSVTVGVVSGLNRSWLRSGVVQEGLIQTDSALNHGNSGGALINLQGQVIGITSTVIRQAETGDTIEGIGFALPSNTVSAIAEQIITSGKVERPDLGVVTIEVTPELALANGLPVEQGAFVREVLPGSAADSAGLRRGDIIVKLGDVDITTTSPLENALKGLRPGEVVVVLVNRGGQEASLDVVLAGR